MSVVLPGVGAMTDEERKAGELVIACFDVIGT